MAFARTAFLGAAAALATGGMMASSASAAPADGPPGNGTVASEASAASNDVGTSTVTKHVWRNAPSYFLYSRAGILHEGNNYFYCQETGRTISVGNYRNNWWLKTDDDSGNTNVWVNAVNISGSANFEPIAGVPKC